MSDRVTPFDDPSNAEQDSVVLESMDDEDFFAPRQTSSTDAALSGSPIIVLPDGIQRPQAIQFLSRDIPHTRYGLPDYFIRSDLLHLQQMLTQDDVDAATVPLSYAEGYPTLDTGSAFWNQLPHEPREAHNCFLDYINQAEETGIRRLDQLAAQKSIDLQQLQGYYAEFYWSARSSAYDLFIVAAEERKRQLRVRSMESKHFELSATRMHELERKFQEEDWMEELNAKEALEMLIELAKLQRLSVGLTGQNASSMPKNPIPVGASPQAIMEHLTRGTSAAREGSDDFMTQLQAMLVDDESGMVLQEAILRVGRPDMQSRPPLPAATMGEDS